MARGLSRRLLRGTPRLNADMSVSILDAQGEPIDLLEPSFLARGGYGYWYERVVGLHYEQRGYKVEYRMRLGFGDRGVDLVASNDSEMRFVQCKLKFQSLSPTMIEQILYKASSLVAEHRKDRRKLFFDLVVPSIAAAFPSRRKPNLALRSFLRRNDIQREVRLNVVEHLPELPTRLAIG